MCEDTKTRSLGVEPPVDAEYVELAAEVFSLLSDPTRVRIILALRNGELAVGELAEQAGKSPTAVSQHLAKLRWAKVVSTRQVGTRVLYSLTDEHALELVTHAVFQAEHVVDRHPAHHVVRNVRATTGATTAVTTAGTTTAGATVGSRTAGPTAGTTTAGTTTGTTNGTTTNGTTTNGTTTAGTTNGTTTAGPTVGTTGSVQ
jgi:DNA-binding transcriptional ArsR family regulator